MILNAFRILYILQLRLKLSNQKKLPDTELPEPRAVLVFTHDRAALEVNDAPVPTVPASKLKETVRKAGKEKSITPDKVKAIQDALELL